MLCKTNSECLLEQAFTSTFFHPCKCLRKQAFAGCFTQHIKFPIIKQKVLKRHFEDQNQSSNRLFWRSLLTSIFKLADHTKMWSNVKNFKRWILAKYVESFFNDSTQSANIHLLKFLILLHWKCENRCQQASSKNIK
jgi:hypothetical protein